MNSSEISRLSIIAAIAASLLAVGVVAAISMAEEADARNQISQSSSVSIDQSGSTTGGGTASNTASVTQSNTASQSNGDTVSQSSSVTVCTNGRCTTTSSTS
jgi:hypothetical protein